jgi:AcrR family transcriptional regulator
MSRLPAAKRKAQLLDSAAKVFAVRGYSGTTTAELARAAGVSEPIIYRHFKSKKDLFIALVRSAGEDTITAWEQGLQGLTNPAERIMRLIRSNPMVTLKGHLRYRVIVQAMSEVEDPDIRKAIHEHIAGLQASLAREVRAAQESGIVSRRFSPELTAWTLIYLGLGYGTISALHIPGHGIDATGTHVDDIIGAIMLGDRYKRDQPHTPHPPHHPHSP